MSTTEPATKGLVRLTTSFGELDIELWPKEAPNAVRNFAQLCMEGFYDGLTFHRLSANFLVQGGCPSGTGEGGLSETIFGHSFGDEYHSRLKFNRRGLVACASSEPNQNGTQFFMTLGPCEHLTRRHTIFGRLTAKTLFNLVPLSSMETDAHERPVGRVLTVVKAVVVEAPFDDLAPRMTPKQPVKGEPEGERQGKEVRKRNTKLLSFGEDEVVDDGELPEKKRPRHEPQHEAQGEERGKEEPVAEEGEQEKEKEKEKEKDEPREAPPPATRMTAIQYAEEEAQRLKRDLVALSQKMGRPERPTAVSEVEKRAAFWEAKRAAGKDKSKKERDQETLERLKRAAGKL
jgi:peptidyl-prolyl cis-trans isomerase SDCCAG10